MQFYFIPIYILRGFPPLMSRLSPKWLESYPEMSSSEAAASFWRHIRLCLFSIPIHSELISCPHLFCSRGSPLPENCDGWLKRNVPHTPSSHPKEPISVAVCEYLFPVFLWWKSSSSSLFSFQQSSPSSLPTIILLFLRDVATFPGWLLSLSLFSLS